MRQQWNIPQDAIVVGYVGRQTKEKNFMAASKAVGQLDDNHYAVYYGTDGTGKKVDEGLKVWCLNNIPGRHRLNMPVNNVGDVYAGLDVLVLASHREACSLVLLEAWHPGVPVVATPVGSVPEMEEELEEKFLGSMIMPSKWLLYRLECGFNSSVRWFRYLPRLEAHQQWVAEEDPDHPTWVVLYQFREVAAYLKTFDVIGTDPYRIGRSPASTAAQWTAEMFRQVKSSRPMWHVPQLHNWAKTYDEVRSMAWQCICEGATGLVFYSWFDVRRNPDVPL